MKKIISILLSITVIVACISSVLSASALNLGSVATAAVQSQSYTDVSVGTIKYRVYDKYATVYLCSTKTQGSVEILPDIDGIPVTDISPTAFWMCTQLSSVSIPSSVRTIQEQAFYGCKSIGKITLPEGIKSVGSRAFYGCSSLDSVYFPSTIEELGDDLFDGCYSELVMYVYSTNTPSCEYAQANNVTYEYRDVDTPVSGIEISDELLRLNLNETYQLSANVVPKKATNKNIKWTSSSPLIVTVSSTGLVTSKIYGVAVITATSEDGGYTATCKVRSGIDVPCTGISITDAKIEMGIGETQQLSTTFEPITATNRNVTWKTSDKNVATVDENGLVTALSTGIVTISVTTEDGGYSASAIIKISSKTLTGLEVTSEPQKTVYTLGDSFDKTGLVITAEYSDGTTADVTNAVIFTGYNKSKTGVQTVKATYPYGLLTASATFKVTVKDKVNIMYNNKIYYDGGTVYKWVFFFFNYTSYTAKLGIDSSVTMKKCSWSSDNEDVSVDANGTVKPLVNKHCSANITLTYLDTDGNTYEHSVKVVFYKFFWQK